MTNPESSTTAPSRLPVILRLLLLCVAFLGLGYLLGWLAGEGLKRLEWEPLKGLKQGIVVVMAVTTILALEAVAVHFPQLRALYARRDETEGEGIGYLAGTYVALLVKLATAAFALGVIPALFEYTQPASQQELKDATTELHKRLDDANKRLKVLGLRWMVVGQRLEDLDANLATMQATLPSPVNLFLPREVLSQSNLPIRLAVLYFDSAGTSGDPAGGGSFSQGTAIEAHHARDLEALGRALRACADGTAEVVVEIRGFASTVPFKGSEDKSPELNLLAATQRARNVAECLARAIEAEDGNPCKDLVGQDVEIDSPVPSTDGKAEIRLPRWENYEDMEHSLGHLDQGDRVRGFLNQRAEIQLTNGGSCQLVSGAAAAGGNQPGMR